VVDDRLVADEQPAAAGTLASGAPHLPCGHDRAQKVTCLLKASGRRRRLPTRGYRQTVPSHVGGCRSRRELHALLGLRRPLSTLPDAVAEHHVEHRDGVLVRRLTLRVAGDSVPCLLLTSAVTSVILGARFVEQLTDNMGAVDLELTAEEVRRLTDVSAPRVDAYPYGAAGVQQRERSIVD